MNKAQTMFLALLFALSLIWFIWSATLVASNAVLGFGIGMLMSAGLIVGTVVISLFVAQAGIALWEFLGKETKA